MKLIVISAPSGAGKTTLCARLLKDFSILDLSISTTTRAPRGQEKPGVHYHFVSVDDFKTGIQQNRFAEWAQVHGNFYGTARSTLESSFAQGRSVLLDIDVQGAASLKKSYGSQTFNVFVAPPSLKILEERLRARGTDDEESIARRLKNAMTEMGRASEFDAQIVNGDFDQAYSELTSLVATALRDHG